MGELGILTNWLDRVPELAADSRAASVGTAARILDYEEANTLAIQVRKRYASRGRVSFELESSLLVPPGVTILLGPSGAGKTTLLRCIAGLDEQQDGRIAVGPRVFFDAVCKINVGADKRNIAFVFQKLALFPHLTVRQNVAYGLRKRKADEQIRLATAIMESFRIAHLAERFPHEVSGGEQQRIALARALVTEPSVLLLDEPLSSLDVVTKAHIIDDLRAWNAAHRIPIIYVTHDHEEVLALGERVITLRDGKVASVTLPQEAWAAARRAAGAFAASTGTEVPCGARFEGTVLAADHCGETVTCKLSVSANEHATNLDAITVGKRIQLCVASNCKS